MAGDDSAVGTAATMAPYILAVPWSFFAKTPSYRTHPQISWIVRRSRTRSQRSPLTFPTSVPSHQQMMMRNFRHRAEQAVRLSFIGGFPNFYEATYDHNHVGGTVFVKSTAAEWRDVPLIALDNASLEDFGERMRATNAYASRNGFVGGFPNFFHADYGCGIVCGSILLNREGAEWRDIPLSELENVSLDDIDARFRATQNYANNNSFAGGFPNLFHADQERISPETGRKYRVTVCGTILLKFGFAEWRDVLPYQDPR